MRTSLHGWCVHCRSRLEIPAASRDAAIECPHCGREVLSAAALEYRQRFHRSGRRIWLGIAIVLLLTLGVLGYLYRGRLRVAFDFLVDQTGSTTAAAVSLAVALLAVVWVALWFLLPILMYFGLKDLRRRASELEETTKLCARHLARLSRDPDMRQRQMGLERDRIKSP